nr:E3 ubiquitin-protein ligase arih1-like [Onthophagus taurus]XP_022913643.1 E3 ubiquitin-protein ligase arih1-like [Onthophagus taurus]
MAYREILCEIFSNKSAETIDNIIRIVEENGGGADDEMLETMINLLSFTGNPDKEDIILTKNSEPDELLDEATGINWDLASSSKKKQDVFTFQKLTDVLPNADPSYLEEKSKELHCEEDLQNFIDNALDNKNYPTVEEYLKRKEEKLERQHYTSNFHLYEFLKEFPDPFTYFEAQNRSHSLLINETDKENKAEDILNQEKDFALTFLYNHFSKQRKRDIKRIFTSYNYDVVKTANQLWKVPPAFKEARLIIPQDDDLKTNILLLKEIAFVKNAKEIRRVIKVQKENIEKSRKLGLLQTCSICYFDELVPEECYICSNECIFCRDCIRQAIQLAINEEKLEMGCLMNCGGDYSLTTLQMVLDRKTFERFWQKKQLHEIEKAKIDGLEFCCLCYKFAYIPNPDDKIFSCTACKQDSCRECKHESHIPLRCNEIEYDKDVQIRTFIENKMTEALVRKCYQCGKQYIKSSGCNKIQCSCGAKMCYLCNVAINNYDHFGDNKCALFTDDNLLHLENVKEGARKAKVELGVDKNPEMLKFDPAKDLES